MVLLGSATRSRTGSVQMHLSKCTGDVSRARPLTLHQQPYTGVGALYAESSSFFLMEIRKLLQQQSRSFHRITLVER